MRARRGLTLIETVLVVSATAVVLGVAVSLLQLLLSTSRAQQEQAVHDGALAELARTFRRDVRAATGMPRAQDPEEHTLLELSLPDEVVAQYQVKPPSVVRVERLNGRLHRQESFSLDIQAGEFEVRADSGVSLVTLVLARPAGGTSRGTLRALRVAAALGRDHRFMAQGVP